MKWSLSVIKMVFLPSTKGRPSLKKAEVIGGSFEFPALADLMAHEPVSAGCDYVFRVVEELFFILNSIQQVLGDNRHEVDGHERQESRGMGKRVFTLIVVLSTASEPA